MIVLLLAIAFAYQVVALIAALAHLLRRDPVPAELPGVSILKPVYGRDSRLYEAIRSHALIDYPSFEILFGVARHDDPALEDIERLQAEFPQVQIRLIHTPTAAPNGKAGVLHQLAGEAVHPVLLANDSDIRVMPAYLREVVAPLQSPAVGLVTCLYRATADSRPAMWEAIGIATDFASSTLVAPLVGVKEFGLGSTLVLRAADLHRIGGFAAVADYIADDYQIGKRISQGGQRVWLSKTVVATHLGSGTWKSVWDHQVRWARTIRLSRGAYLGLPIANGSLWALLGFMTGHSLFAGCLLALRLAVGLLVAGLVLHDWSAVRMFWLVPFRDLFGFAVWCAGVSGRDVIWRGKRMRLDRQGRIVSVE